MTWVRRLLNHFRSNQLSADIDRESAFHIAETVDELTAAGMARDLALREAQRRFGNRTAVIEQTRGVNLIPWFETLVADTRYAVRTMRRTPVVTTALVLSLGLAIGAATAVFTLSDVILFRPLPVQAAHDLRQVVSVSASDGSISEPLSYAQFQELRARQGVFASLAAVSRRAFEEVESGEVRRHWGAWVSGEFFALLGVQTIVGRRIQPSDDRPGCPVIAVLDHGFWQRRFGGDRSVIGRQLVLEGYPFEIVGVAAPGFSGVHVGDATSLYAPLCAMAPVLGAFSPLAERNSFFLTVLGRVKAGMTYVELAAGLRTLAPGIQAATVPEGWSAPQQQEYLSTSFEPQSAANGFSRVRARYGPALAMLSVIVGLVLLVACANVTNLLLARSVAREREIAVRLAVGAGRARLARQFLTEGLLLALFGATLGLVFARWSTGLLVHFISTRFLTVTLDLSPVPRVLGFTLAVAVVTGCFFALAPTWRAVRSQWQNTLGASSRSVVRGARGFRLGNALVAGQVALSFVLLTTAALLVGTWWQLVTVNDGFERGGVMVASVDVSRADLTPAARRVFYEALIRRAESVPGIAAVGATDIVPLSGRSVRTTVIAGGLAATDQDGGPAWRLRVGSGYLKALRLPLVAGRDFGPDDRPTSQPVALVNETMARKFFGDSNVLGREFRTRLGDAGDIASVRVIGVVRDAKHVTLREEYLPTFYLALAQEVTWGSRLEVVLRTSGPPDAVIPLLRQMVIEANGSAVVQVTPLERIVADSMIRERLLATVSGFFGVVAVLLAIVGLYGIVSYQVTRTQRELGVRMALGAARAEVFHLVLRHVGVLVTIGLTTGALLSITGARLVSAFLYGIAPSDPLVLCSAAAILATSAAVAGAIPARRASRLDPVLVLRDE